MTEQLRNTILGRWQEGASLRRIARELHLSRRTVRRVVTGVEAQRAGRSAPRPSRSHALDAYETVMHELLARYPDLTGVRLFEELRQRGFAGSYSTVRLRLRELRPRTGPRPVVRFETGPGVQAQMDYAIYDLDFSAEGRRRVYAFSYVLAYSRRQYLRFVEAQDLETTLRQHVRAFDYFGGVAASCLYDNMKVVVQGYEDDVPLYNQRFLAFATHYGFRPRACRPYRPQTKGKVERPFAYVQTNLLNGRTFRTLAHLNEVALEWLAHVADVRIHGQTKKTPLELYAQEKPHLIPLPAQPYEVSPVCYRVVNVEGTIVYRQNRYSVPWQHIGRTLPVRVTETEVIVYDPQVQESARHLVFPRSVTGQCRQQPAHRPAEDVHQRQVQLQARFAELGEVAARFLDALLRTQRYGKDQAQRVLALLATYHRVDVLAALERAVRYGAFSYAAVERILAVQAQPKSVLETLAQEQRPHLAALLGDTAVSARPLTDYRSLFAEEATHDAPSNPPDPGPPVRPDPQPGPTAADVGGEPA
jgi:transposase